MKFLIDTAVQAGLLRADVVTVPAVQAPQPLALLASERKSPR
jgi:hypothetical protein